MANEELKVYEYARCGTCVKAKKFLKANAVDFKDIPIVDNPPSLEELEKMLGYLKAKGMKINHLFNTSGVMYKELGMSKKLPLMTESEALHLLAENGKLIKRPFVLLENDGMVGFKEEEWKKNIL